MLQIYIEQGLIGAFGSRDKELRQLTTRLLINGMDHGIALTLVFQHDFCQFLDVSLFLRETDKIIKYSLAFTTANDTMVFHGYL